MSWNLEKIEATERAHVERTLGDAGRDRLVEEIVALRKVLHPILCTLSSIDDRAPRGVHLTSKLFPALFGEGENEGKLAAWNEATRDFDWVSLPSHELHTVEYEEAESTTVLNGKDGSTRLDDSVAVLAAHSHWIAAYAFGGEITMGDVRRAVAVMWPPKADPAAG